MITHAAPQKHYTVLLSRPVLAYIFIRDANLALYAHIELPKSKYKWYESEWQETKWQESICCCLYPAP